MEMPTVTAPTSAPARFATTPCPFCGQLNRTDLARLAAGPRCGSRPPAPPSAPARFATTPCPFCGQLNRTDLARLADGPRCGSCRRPLHFDRPVPVSDGGLDGVPCARAAPLLGGF